MISLPFKLLIFTVIVFLAFEVVGTQSVSVLTIPLDKTVTRTNRELYTDFININRSSFIEVEFSDINTKNVSFIIFQVHSHLYNVTVCNDSTFSDPTCESGTNVGLYSLINSNKSLYIWNQNEDTDLTLLVLVHGYRKQDPIPGGCNMVYRFPITPFMHTNLQKDIIDVDVAPPMIYKDLKCISNTEDKMSLVFYVMYLAEGDIGATTYFDGIKKMSTLESIRQNGYRIGANKWPMRRTFSAYPGTGSIYVAIVTDKRSPELSYSVYIPSSNYACSPLHADSCELIDNYLSKFICASLIFVGVFVCYFGHRFFKTEMFIFGLSSGFIITYVVISLLANLSGAVLITGSLLSGVFFGAIWLTFWWYYGIPVIAVCLPALNMGFLISSIMYNKLPDDLPILEDDFNFWLVFILGMVLVSLLILAFIAFITDILCCAVLGAYAVVFPMDYYFGSNIKYIIINTFRRAVVPKFNKAVLLIPFEWKDAIIVVFWIGLAVTGFLFQHFHNRGRPPFPPPPSSVRPGRPDSTRYGALPTRRNVASAVGASTPVAGRPYNERTPLLA